MAIKKITNVFDHVSGGWRICSAAVGGRAATTDASTAALGVVAGSPVPWPPPCQPFAAPTATCASHTAAAAYATPHAVPPPHAIHSTTITALAAALSAADATRILREIKLLRLLRHPDIVEIKHIMMPPSSRDFKDIYVVFELMETDLHQV